MLQITQILITTMETLTNHILMMNTNNIKYKDIISKEIIIVIKGNLVCIMIIEPKTMEILIIMEMLMQLTRLLFRNRIAFKNHPILSSLRESIKTRYCRKMEKM